MLTRRKFLKSTVTTLILIPIVGCSDDESPTSTDGGGNGCEGVSSTGSTSAGHRHTLCVPSSDLTSPPASGRTYSTSTDAGHSHSVTLSQLQLEAVEAGQTVMVDSTGGGHIHAFTIEKS